MKYRRIASFKTLAEFQDYLGELGLQLPLESGLESGAAAPLAQPCVLHNGFTIGNRFCILPMEGWDGTTEGRPTAATYRRWQRFGQSGAKLIWGGEAVAVRHDGRANPNQLLITPANLPELAKLRETLVKTHERHFGSSSDLLVGLQLTHSGRFSKPNRHDRPEPQILYHHPVLDRRVGLRAEHPVMSDEEVARLIDDFVRATRLAQAAGFAFVDLKHCHGYLGHEFLSAVRRPGRYGGSFENRTRFLRELVAGIRAQAPGLAIGVRLSAFDFLPYRAGAQGVGEPERPAEGDCPFAFGADASGLHIDLTEPRAFLDLLASLQIELVCVTAGSPYYNPHIQRPAYFPPCDGYLPPEDPLAGVARQIAVTAQLKQYRPDLIFVGSGYTYLQEWLPHVAQAVIRRRLADFVGLGRMVLSYPELPADVLAGRPLARKRLCRTFSDCTTAPRNGLPSGCYPLDDFYKRRPEAVQLLRIKGKTGKQ
ncbi:MAG: NADH:flavin oxidoreductase [candidate division KSB1 bacterium]|nr:NADH:flavin oxidoreductase [candidate division KSB1 bacterium]MDZ7276234.1 NADH:flavin oxidoreductase [candidate division KSB1 bacterium]MDZ7287960.1 NADH:flavin oxidoreductase [candidate division KSB1 bacterium]MDZ7300027.1 NADH:flavin oxidoreductase [candidate division KSB1 bacterium]MDZ7308417.1 NADH:flavin oxidoreductase [candidate division KSB1 bacterium]